MRRSGSGGIQDGLAHSRQPRSFIADSRALPVECDDITLLKQLVPGADIVLICANMLVAREIAAGDMVRLPIPNLAPAYGDWGIVKLAGRTLSPAARIMVDQLCGIMAEMAGGRPAGGP